MVLKLIMLVLGQNTRLEVDHRYVLGGRPLRVRHRVPLVRRVGVHAMLLVSRHLLLHELRLLRLELMLELHVLIDTLHWMEGRVHHTRLLVHSGEH